MMKFKLIAALLVITIQMITAAPQKVISYNIRYDSGGDTGVRDWRERAPQIIKFLKESKPSVIGLQEVLDNQLKDLEKNLPAYGRVGVGRDDGISKGEHSPIFYDESVWRMDEEDQGTFWLSDTPKVAGSKSWGNGITRICTWVRLIDKEGKGIYIYNTHWDHRSKPSREKSAALILKTIKQRKHKNEPYLLMGDLNANTDSEAVKTLLADAYLIDHGTQQAVTFNSWAAKLTDGLRIDHIFVSPHFKKAAVTVKVTVKVVSNGDPPASDHHPVVMTVEFTTFAKPLFPKDVSDPSNSPTNPCK